MRKALKFGKILEGYKRVKNGLIQEGDLAWDPGKPKWTNPFKDRRVVFLEPGANQWDWLRVSRMTGLTPLYREVKMFDAVIRPLIVVKGKQNARAVGVDKRS